MERTMKSDNYMLKFKDLLKIHKEIIEMQIQLNKLQQDLENTLVYDMSSGESEELWREVYGE